MAYQMTFKRYELKYLLNRQDKAQILLAMEPYMKLDDYGRTVIRNIYFDTDTFRLIRRSLEKPVYKEKLRIRSYKPVEKSDPVFVEIKKKYKSVVYKRRLQLPEEKVMDSFQTGEPLPVHSQIGNEIQYFRDYYENLHPSVFLSYEREAYYSLDGSDFRVTFDENILYRRNDFSLGSEIYGFSLLGNDQTLMEIKTSGGIPLWMSEVLTKQHLYKTSFSKYGSAYQRILTESLQGGNNNALFQGIFDTNMTSVISISDFLLCVGCALVIGLILAGTYMYGIKYTKSFVATLALLPAVVCVVIMMVNGNVGTGVAVAGAFSLVRFRSVPGSAKEIGAIFLAMCSGLVAGMGYLAYALLSAAILGSIMLLYNRLDFGTRKHGARYKTLHITIPEDLDYSGEFDKI